MLVELWTTGSAPFAYHDLSPFEPLPPLLAYGTTDGRVVRAYLLHFVEDPLNWRLAPVYIESTAHQRLPGSVLAERARHAT